MSRSRRSGSKVERTKPVPRPRMPFAVVLRVFVLGSVAAGASGYAVYRHYTFRAPPMVVPARPSAAPELGPIDLVPAPELVPVAPSR